MTHDSRCEGPQGDAHTRWICRCEVRALEARLAEAEGKALAYNDAHAGDWHDRAHKLAQQSARDAGRNVWHIAVERAERAEALVAEWRNVVRAAIRQESGEEAYDRTDEAVAALSPSAREAAR